MKKLWLDNTQLDLAAECLESYATALDDEGEIEEAGCARETAETFREISKASLDSSEVTETVPGVRFTSVKITIRGTSEGTVTQRRKPCKPKS